MPKIINFSVHDVRFPTSLDKHGSDAKNKDPDYSAAYVTLITDNPDLEGNGLTFTIGDGNDIVVEFIKKLMPQLIGQELSEITKNMKAFWRNLAYGNSHLGWLGEDSGVKALATAAVVNAVWDLWAKSENKPLWRLISDFTPEQFLQCVDLYYLRDAITEDEALSILNVMHSRKPEQIAKLEQYGYPAYCTSGGWLGYSDEKLVESCKKLAQEGWQYIKIKIGGNFEDDYRRLKMVREAIGSDIKIMVDANQVFNPDDAIEYIEGLKEFGLFFFEEPTKPTDVYGHAKIRHAIYTNKIATGRHSEAIKVATGEHCPSSLLWKQFFQFRAIDFCQLDPCRLMGINEALAVMLMAKKFNVPVYPHAGGVGLCNIVQHLSYIYYTCISEDAGVTEYVDHLQEHFVDPVKMLGGCYLPPSKPGASLTMNPQSVIDYDYNGSIWQRIKKRGERPILLKDKIAVHSGHPFFGHQLQKLPAQSEKEERIIDAAKMGDT